jgi:hypothetical protein
LWEIDWTAPNSRLICVIVTLCSSRRALSSLMNAGSFSDWTIVVCWY